MSIAILDVQKVTSYPAPAPSKPCSTCKYLQVLPHSSCEPYTRILTSECSLLLAGDSAQGSLFNLTSTIVAIGDKIYVEASYAPGLHVCEINFTVRPCPTTISDHLGAEALEIEKFGKLSISHMPTASQSASGHNQRKNSKLC